MQNKTGIQNENKMGVMPVKKLLLSMSIPMMIAMIVQAMYNVVDSIFVAQISENALTAISLAFPIQNLMIAVGIGTGVGMNALLSKSLGEKNFKQVNKAADNGVFLGILGYLLFLLFGVLGSKLFFSTQTNDLEIIKYGTTYLSTCCIFSFGIFGQLTFERLLQSTGKTFYTLITQGVGAVVNIVLDPILIFGYFGFPRMGIKGAAVATISGQIIAMLLAIYLNKQKNHEIKLSIRDFRPDLKIIKKIYAVGLPSIVMVSIASIMVYGMNKILLSFTATATAVFGIYFKLQSFVFMPVFGLNNGMVPILAYNLGAKKKGRIVKTIKLSVIYATGITLLGLIIMQVFPNQIFALFNAEKNMLLLGIPALRIISISFIFAGCSIVLLSVFQALGHGMLSLEVSVIRQLVILLPVAYVLSLTQSVNLIWWAFPISELIAAVFALAFMKRVYHKEIENIKSDDLAA
jgi:putative MATE family efflux protein